MSPNKKFGQTDGGATAPNLKNNQVLVPSVSPVKPASTLDSNK